MRKLFLGGNNYILHRLMRDRDMAPAVDLSLYGWLSATRGGAPIHDDLKRTLIAGDRELIGGVEHQRYEAVLNSSVLLQHLASFAGKVIYDRCQRFGGTDFDHSVAVEVVAARGDGE